MQNSSVIDIQKAAIAYTSVLAKASRLVSHMRMNNVPLSEEGENILSDLEAATLYVRRGF